MDYKVFYRKYRPDSFNSIIGQEYTKTMLQNAIMNNKISHAYIFTGPRGTGKTSTAKVFAKAINCENPQNGEPCGNCVSCKNFATSSDIIEIDAASNNGVDEIRELINNVKIAPANSKYKIYIIDEVHMMTQSAFNALLLTLEEPPAHVIFIMATTNIESVPITILSRCQRFDFKKFSMEDLIKQLHYVSDKENIDITEDALTEIAYISEGGLRDALSLLDQLSSNNEKITIENILSNYGSISTIFVKNLINSILNNDVSQVIKDIEDLSNSSADYKIFIKKLIQELVEIAIKMKTEFMNIRFDYEKVKQFIFELNDCMNRTNINVNPYSLIEIIILNYMNPNNMEGTKVNNKSESEISIKTDDKVVDNITEEIVEEPRKGLEENSNEDEKIKNLQNLQEIRINNCFVSAKKDYLIQMKEFWKNINSMNIPQDILGILIDAEVVASSSEVVILSAPLDATALLINSKIYDIDSILSDLFGKKLKFISLSIDQWKKEKDIYVNNLKNGVKYEVIEEINENSQVKKEEDNKTEDTIEKVAEDLFDLSKIEIV